MQQLLPDLIGARDVPMTCLVDDKNPCVLFAVAIALSFVANLMTNIFKIMIDMGLEGLHRQEKKLFVIYKNVCRCDEAASRS
jgi:hypothetical protein